MNQASNAALLTFAIYTVAVLLLAILSNRVAQGKEFIGEYFLGSRGFGVWAFALTFAATNASGGTFMGFPALIYTHGWSLALWIAGYMALPLLSMGLIGKRLNQVARRTNAVTIPEVLGGRFSSPTVNLVATLLLVLFMFFYLLAQFKAGGKILSTLLSDEPMFQAAAVTVSGYTDQIPWINRASGDYLLCLFVFAVSVIVYVVYGGFRAVVWTDVMQGLVMFGGVILLLIFSLYQVGGLDRATRELAKMTPPEKVTAVLHCQHPDDTDWLIPKGAWILNQGQAFRLSDTVVVAANRQQTEQVRLLRITTPSEIERISQDTLILDQQAALRQAVRVEVVETTPYAYGADQEGVYITATGPSATNPLGFLALGTAISFFIFWPFGATAQPANMVRLMAFNNSRTLRYSIVTVTVYYAVIYFALIVIFCCGRILLPGMEIDPDRTMPDLAARVTSNAGVPWVAGLLVAAPFAAVMSSVDSFLLLVSSSIVRDIYQRRLSPQASERTLKRLSHLVTVIVGVLAVVLVVNPPTYLQDLIVFATAGLAACFLIPVTLSLYWPRMNAAGAIAGMLGGTGMHIVLTGWGYWEHQEFQAYEFLGLSPFIWDLGASALAAVVAALATPGDRQAFHDFFQSK